MNDDAQVYLHDVPNTNWTDSALLSAGLTYFRRTANDSSYNYDMYLHGHEALIQATTSGSAYLRSTRMNIWGFEDSYVSTTDGEYGNLSYHGLNFRQKKSAGSELDTATTSAGYFKIEHGIASDGVNISTIMRSITADVLSGAQISIQNGIHSSTTSAVDISFSSTGFDESSKMDRDDIVFTGATTQGSLSAIGMYASDSSITDKFAGLLVNDTAYGSNPTLKLGYNGAQLLVVSSAASNYLLSKTGGVVSAADFQLSTSATCFVGQDFDIRNNKGLLIGGSSAISSARVGSFTGLTSTGGVTITGGDISVTANAIIRGNAGTQRILRFRTGDLNRWSMLCSSDAESGGNAGSDLAIFSFNDAGTTIDVPLVIQRLAGGIISLNRPVYSSETFKAFKGIGFYNTTPPITRPTATGSRGGNAALASLLTHLAACGIIADSTTA